MSTDTPHEPYPPAASAGPVPGPEVAAAIRILLSYVEEHEAADPRTALAAAGRARRAWKRWEPRVIELIVTNREAKVPASTIADELGVSESYVYRIAREYSRYTWRLDVLDVGHDGGWREYQRGDDVAEDPAHLVEPVVVEALGDTAEATTARVTIWRANDGERADPVLTQECPALSAPE
ncbi:helix-turn-helix domain-containing protein [Streptomyces litchfieldiae]|uniref:Helix-turn-helix domain-containing protein n=1 Tax=Streptomyces litchfieldiae TaxID=3075543 RepID=A0ABU2MYP7_9ACTN|nr:helix-turn-helix domain-containing protein [Streptomyces sp. DSM 44938]MDT0346773.1 helix-turn-helix domain-containing protein [Streptomyces sp. DSM 44938]